METVEKTVDGRDFFLGVFPTSFHSAWKTRRSIRKPSVVERRRVSHSSHSPTATIITYRTSKPRETDRQLVSANPVLYKIHRPDISLATKSGHFNLLRTSVWPSCCTASSKVVDSDAFRPSGKRPSNDAIRRMTPGSDQWSMVSGRAE